MRRGAAIGLAACALAGGCGSGAGDLMAIDVSGGFAKARGPLDIVLTGNGEGSCNGGPNETLPSELVIDSRELERDLGDLAEKGASYQATRRDQARYVVRIKAGTVRWAEGARGLPAVLPKTQLLTLRLVRLLCP